MRKLHVAALRSYFLGSSVFALMAGCAAAASAGCTAGSSINCTGTTVGEITLASSGGIIVANGATLSAGAGDYAALGVTSTGSSAGYSYAPTYATITANGTISGNQAGILGNATGWNYAYPSTNLNITVGTTGQVLGQTAIYLDAGGTGFHTVEASLDNQGLVQGSDIALASNGSAGFTTVNNEAGGVIRGANGAIAAPVGYLTNAGLIDGGTGSAYAVSSASGWPVYPWNVTNSGTMTSGSASGTIYLSGGSPQITNSGTIQNTSGPAIYDSNYLTLTNAAGGVITSPSTANAVYAANGGNIVNQGTIIGSVFAGSSYYNSTVLDNSKGTINGNILFGGGTNTLIASWDASGNRISGISGTISGTAGTGTNMLELDVSQSLTIDNLLAHLVMPSYFQTLGIRFDSGVIGTLNGSVSSGLLVGGAGDVVVNGQVAAAGAAFTQLPNSGYDYTSRLGFANNGSIRSVFSPPGGWIQYSDYALSLSNLRSFSNSGTITAVAGNGVSAGFGYYGGSGTFSNSGSIVADGTALNLSMYSGTGTNSGTIRSTAGTGLLLSGGTLSNTGSIAGTTGATVFSGTLANSGTITGTTTGAQLSGGALSNSGTITGTTAGVQGFGGTLSNSGTITATTGTAVNLSYGTINNLAGGVITGSGDAIESGFGGNTINNAGTINGNVNFTTAPYYYYANNTFVDNGGTVNGSVLFASGGSNTYVTDLSKFVNGAFSNVTGTVDGGGGSYSTLVLKVGSDTSAKIAYANTFAQTAYDLSNGAKLSLGSDTTAAKTVVLGGTGSVDLTANVSVTGAASLTDTASFGSIYVASTALSVGNEGSLRSVFSPPGGVVQYSDYAVYLSGLNAFSNSGTIASVGGNGAYIGLASSYGTTGVSFANSGSIVADGTALNLSMGYYGTGTGTNSGTIRSTGGTGLWLYGSGGIFANTGSITGTTGASVNFGTLSNSGTITGTTTGVQLSGGTLSNSGTITATNGTAVSLSSGGTVNNLAGGVITGAGDAIETSYGVSTVTNAGTINGNVNFATTPYYYYANNTFVDNGGTVNGSVLFGGSGTNTYVTDLSKFVNGTFSNVTGTVDGGSGSNSTLVLRVGSDTTANIAFAKTFTQTQYDLSNGAKLSLSSDTTLNKTLLLSGTGSVDLTANFNIVNGQALGVTTAYGSSYGTPGTLSIVSHGDMSFSAGYNDTGIGLSYTTNFENAGNISFASQYNFYPAASAIYGGAQVTNSGTITLSNAAGVQGAQTVVNTGSIAQAANGQFSYGLYNVNSVVNSGTISTGGTAVTLGNYYYYYSATPITGPSIVNSGLIHSTGSDAIVQYGYYYNPASAATITNKAGGQIISDMGAAISGYGYGTNIYNDGLISGNINLYYGNGLIENHGTINGNINLYYGNNTVLLTGGTFTGSATAWLSGYPWSGYNRLVLNVTDANAPTLALGTSAFTGFQELDMQAGTASMGGGYLFNTVNVSGGRLIGLAGSVLVAPSITVAQGATFGSAGIVAGDIAVAGTLSPGASPGTMTVIGNVNLAKGSTSLFELTPTVDDKLLVSGTLTIADGATLQFTGKPKLTPGQRLDLIEATGGVSGTFSTISGKPASLYLIQSADGLQGLQLFSTNADYPTQVQGVIGTLNTALINNTVSASLINAMPALVYPDSGDSNPNALVRLTPQAYASAPQLAVADTFAVVDASREQSHFTAGKPEAFAFGQAIGSGRKMAGEARTGLAEGRIADNGMLSGFGFGTRSAWGEAFFGYLDGVERLPDLDARTTTHSAVIGAQEQVQAGALRLGLMAAYDRAEANTRRAVPGGDTTAARYALKTSMVDAVISYRAPLNEDWAVEPRLGATYMRTTRDGLAEQGGSPFALNVQGGRSTYSFIDGHIEFDGGQRAGEALHPFVSVGFVTRSGGYDAPATAWVNGLPDPLTADGLALDGTRATLGGGVRYDVSSRMKMSASYDGEFGHNGRQRLMLGLDWAF